jgi:hypothetical protein
MDPSLNRLLAPYGLQFDAIGPLTDYHGPRRPYLIDLLRMLETTYVNNSEIWELITNYGSVRLGAFKAHPQNIIARNVNSEALEQRSLRS